ncbi:HNH endonuclease [Curvibacter phage P26059A]|nr:HNH endonuclease [Curvibacter phage P26059A]
MQEPKKQPLPLKDLLKFLQYNPLTGEFSVITSGNPTNCTNLVGNPLSAVTSRKILPDEDNKIQTTIQGTRLSIKADRLAWFISTGKQPARFQVVFHKNLDWNDNRLNNLVLLQKNEYMQLQEAMKNISGALKLVPHPNDMFSYMLFYKHNGRMLREIVQDISIARRKFNKLQLKYVKIISKYTVSD